MNQHYKKSPNLGISQNKITRYISELDKYFSTGKATEHTYRPAIKLFVEDFDNNSISAINEPKRKSYGAPDIIVECEGVPVGHIECKNVDVDLNEAESSIQLLRYRDALPNLILTNYHEFRLYINGKLCMSEKVLEYNKFTGFWKTNHDSKSVEKLFRTFLDFKAPTISSPQELAQRMAAKTKLIRDNIEQIIIDGKDGPYHNLMSAYRDVLFPDITYEQFADFQAQTVTYGLFAARCVHDNQSDVFTRKSAIFSNTTPFLREVFNLIAGPKIDDRIEWIVNDLAYLFQKSDISSILEKYEDRSEQDDPIIHFYEYFLSEYHPKNRSLRGIYYTPKPIVSYIVRSIDWILRNKFNIEDGLADTSSVEHETKEGKQNIPRVLVLDPATGTGTFLCTVINHIRQNLENRGIIGTWPNYVQEHLIERIHGFELMMTPYTICHLKLALELGTDLGFNVLDSINFNVYLTNTLEKPQESEIGPLFASEIKQEASEADKIKREKPIMVILGNPPYSGHSANKGEWIGELIRGFDGNSRTESYFEVDGQPLEERNLKWLHDDYVKFIRFAQDRIDRSSEGVIGFVTNHSYLDSPTFRGMRNSLCRTFDEIYILNLHGNTNLNEKSPSGGKDENVFNIKQGVAIGFFIKYSSKYSNSSSYRVFYEDLWGTRKSVSSIGKYPWLNSNDIETTNWKELYPKYPSYLFIPRDESLDQEYDNCFKITDIFPVHSVGIVTARDKITIQYTIEEMRQFVDKFSKMEEEKARQEFDLGNDSRDWKVTLAQNDIQSQFNIESSINKILYRPFDKRYTFYTGKSRGFLCSPSPKVMHHMLAGSNLALVSCRQQSQLKEEWRHCSVTQSITESCSISNKTRENNYLFPIYTYPEKNADNYGEKRQINIDDKFIDLVCRTVDIIYKPDEIGEFNSIIGPKHIFYYILAILNSTNYSKRYAGKLKSDFPRIPLTSNRELFVNLIKYGEMITNLLLLKIKEEKLPNYTVDGTNKVIKIRYTHVENKNALNRVWINDTQYFEGVIYKVWNFKIGSYYPAQKWLKDRVGRQLTYNDIRHYKKICSALKKLSNVIVKIDQAIDFHGGWPLK